jgi:hypothetical protein
LERTIIERRRVAHQSTNVAVSLRRDEPPGTRLCGIWPVIFPDAITCGEVHDMPQVKERGLITAERDGYIGCLIRRKNIGDTEFVDAKAHISEEHFATLQKHRFFPVMLLLRPLEKIRHDHALCRTISGLPL